MKRYGYRPSDAYGVVAAGGTLGILIPPSGPLILYAIVTESSIGALFLAGLIPGVLISLIFAGFCMAQAAYLQGKKLYDQREIEYGNLAAHRSRASLFSCV